MFHHKQTLNCSKKLKDQGLTVDEVKWHWVHCTVDEVKWHWVHCKQKMRYKGTMLLLSDMQRS